MFFCPHCGADRRTVAPIAPCPGCGVALADRDPIRQTEELDVASTARDDDDRPPRSRVRLGIAAAGAVAALGLGVVMVAWCGKGDGPTRAPNVVAATPRANEPTEPPPPPKPEMPKWIVLRVERVQVAASDTEWDGPAVDSSFKEICKGLSSLVGAARPEVGGVARIGCSLLSGEKQRQADPRDPDLQVILDMAGASYRSYVATDRRAHLFEYPFVVPGDAVPPDGLVLSVVDADANAPRGQEIGSVRLTRDEIITLTTSGQLITRQSESLALLEFSVRPHDAKLRKADVTLAANRGGVDVRGIEVNAGDVVRVEASGTWQIGSWNADWLGPDGYTDGRLKDSNLDLFPRDSHGAAVAVVGQQEAAALLRPHPCERFVSPFAGVVWVGINDRKPGDNNGEAHYRVFTRAPKAAEWRAPGVLLGCAP